ncbi:MAG: helix-turn-helix domain-containing protein [Prevotellaceae bacterium]|jgi:transcriptional regulator with XRE-family HTH domain|nr:helix-turn-helix domain-containing protein [Prevotellaceae bacterium]
MTDNDMFVFGFCDRLRKLRKRMNLNIEDVAERCGLTFNQIQRLEGDMRMRDNETVIKKSGANGTIPTILTLLNFYGQKVSLDMLFDLNIPVADIPLTKAAVNEISRTKLLTLIDDLKEIARYI